MNKDDILIVKYPFLMKNVDASKLYESLLKQKETGIIIIPDYCEVVIAPKDIEIQTKNKVMTEQEYIKNAWMTEGREFERG